MNRPSKPNPGLVPLEPMPVEGSAARPARPLRPGFVLIANSLTPTNCRLMGALRRAAPGARFVRPSQLDGIDRPSGALARLDVSRDVDGMEDGFAALLRFERTAPVMNGVAALTACHDKLVTARVLADAGLPHPQTVALPKCSGHALGLRPPLVVKPRFGAWGKHVALCRDADEFAHHLGLLSRASWFKRCGGIAQELIPPTGIDLRLLVAAGEVVGAVERLAAPGEWRTNISLGARRRPTTPPAEAQALAIAAAAAVDADLVCVDLLPIPGGGYVILELNGAADFCDTYSLEGQVVFDQVARRLLERTSARPAHEASVAAI
jgi:RimK family alpha-L-glutamate ligase